MKDILKRDITGKCVGECRNRVLEAERQRQSEINRMQSQLDRQREHAGKT